MSLPFRTLWSLVGALISLAALQAQDVLWGVTPVGGTDGAGTVYSISTSGTYQKEHDFEVVLGNLPKSDLVLINGKYYGTTEQTSGALGGVIFSYDPVTLEYAVEAQFVSGLSGTGIAPRRGMVLASNGKLYGTCALGGPLNSLGGTIFEFDPVTKALVAKVGFGFGGQPQCRLVPNAAGNVLYGTTNLGNGTIFSYIPGQTTVTTLHTFNGSNGTDPIVGVVRSGSILYGTTQDGGTNGVGVLYSYNLSTSTFTVLHHFSTGTGSTPLGELLVLPQGIFGTTSEGASGFGAVFRYVSGGSPAYQLVHDFSSTDGAAPKSGLVRSTTDGAIYGTTSQGGTGNKGVVFSVDPVSLVLTLRAQFGTTTFGTPLAGLVQTGTNEFIGTASSGGPSGNGGAVYLFNAASNTFETLVTLGQAIGQGPSGQLCLASDGKLYGTTQQGGQFGTGVLYRIDRNTGTFQSLHDFGGLDGTGPVGGLVEVNGKLYGVCGSGGSQLGGTVFSYQPSTGTYAVIANFTNQTGKTPLAGLMQASNGQLYGTTSSGAALNGTTNGTLFSINPNLTTPTIQVRHIFDVTGTEGTNCQGPLFQASSGLLYGTCQTGGLQNTGTMFRFDTSSQIFTKLQDFIGTLNVGDPTGTLVERSNGLIYGTGSTGGGISSGGCSPSTLPPTRSSCVPASATRTT